jgi:hypothetical protein
MSTLRSAKKSIGAINPPALIGADYGTRSNEFWMMNQAGGIDYKFTYSGHYSSLKAFTKCAPLNAVIIKKAQAFVNGKTWIVNKKGKAKDKESTTELADKVRKLMSSPNPFQTQKEFEAQQYIYAQIFGFCLLLPIKPVGYPVSDAKRLWNIPPSMVNIEETKKNWLLAESKLDLVKKIVIDFGEERAEIPVSDVVIIKDFTPSFSSPIFPESRICALEMPINNIIGAYESRNVLINYRGALGIISPDAKDVGGPVPLSDPQKEQLQEDFLRYGLKNNQWKFIISSASVKWSQMGVSTKDLMLFEEIEDDIQRICDSYSYPYPLISSAKQNNLGGTNTDPNKRLLYQDTIIPEAESICEQWNILFDMDSSGLVIIKDYSHVPVLQDDEQKKALSRKTRNEARQIEFYNNVCTLNEWRVANGDDPANADTGDKFYYELVAIGWKFGTGSITLQAGSNNDSNNNNNQNNSTEQQ